MKKMNKILIIISVSVLTMSMLFAQTKEDPWTIGLHGNVTSYKGDLGNYLLKFDGSKLGVAVSGTYYLNPFLDLKAKISYTGMEIYDEDGTYAAGYNGYADVVGTPYGSWGFDGKLLANTINVVYKFNNNSLLPVKAALKPFLIGGIGTTIMKTKITRNVKSTKTYHNMDLYYGFGFKYTHKEKYNIIFELGYHNNMNDDLDGLSATTAPGWSSKGNNYPQETGSTGPIGRVSDSNDKFQQISLGLSYQLDFKKKGDEEITSLK